GVHLDHRAGGLLHVLDLAPAHAAEVAPRVIGVDASVAARDVDGILDFTDGQTELIELPDARLPIGILRDRHALFDRTPLPRVPLLDEAAHVGVPLALIGAANCGDFLDCLRPSDGIL